MSETIPERILQITKALVTRGIIPFTRKDIHEALPDVNVDSLYPMIQAMTVNTQGGAPIARKYEKKYLWRVTYGKYVLLWRPD